MVTWTTTAVNDLKYIHNFIARDSNYYAKKVIQEIRAKSVTLNAFPKIGKLTPEIDNIHIREFHIYSYRVIYEVQDTDCFILAVIHKRRDFSADQLP